MFIKTVKTRSGKTAYIVCLEGGSEVMHFWRKDRAEAWLRGEIYA